MKFTIMQQINAINKHCVRNGLTVINYRLNGCWVEADLSDDGFTSIVDIVVCSRRPKWISAQKEFDKLEYTLLKTIKK
jgi:hypothetical protein